MQRKLNNFRKRLAETDNKGFSIVELIIAVTILVVLALTTTMMMSSGSDFFSRTNTREQLQYRSQLALAQIKEYCPSCTGIAVEEGKLHVIDKDRDGNERLYTFELDSSSESYKERKINVLEQEFVIMGNSATVTTLTESPLINSVKVFDVTVNSSSKGTADSVNIKLTVFNGSRSYTKTYTVALRTKPVYVATATGNDTDIRNTLVKAASKSSVTTTASSGE